MVKGKRYRLVYSNRPPFDRRPYGLHVYTNNFECLVRVICGREIDEARKRVKTNKRGTFYRYIPSKEYIAALTNHRFNHH